jgi:hypothetical protein
MRAALACPSAFTQRRRVVLLQGSGLDEDFDGQRDQVAGVVEATAGMVDAMPTSHDSRIRVLDGTGAGMDPPMPRRLAASEMDYERGSGAGGPRIRL